MKELSLGRGDTCRYVARVLLTQGILHQRTPAIQPNDLGLEHLLQVLKENMQLNQKHIFKQKWEYMFLAKESTSLHLPALVFKKPT